MAATTREALSIHWETIQRMEAAVQETNELHKALKSSEDHTEWLHKQIVNLKREAAVTEVLTTRACDEAADHIKEQDDKIAQLREKLAEYSALLVSAENGDNVPSYIQRMECAVREAADLQEKLRKARSIIDTQEQTIDQLRGELKKLVTIDQLREENDYLNKRCNELKKEVADIKDLMIHTLDDATEHIKKQNLEIEALKAEQALLLDGAEDGDSVPSYRTMKKDYIEAITRIELYKVRLANCRYLAERISATNYDSKVGYLRNCIITETRVNTWEKINGQP